MLERLNEEIKRRTRVVRIFPDPASCLRLVRALAVFGGRPSTSRVPNDPAAVALWVAGLEAKDMVVYEGEPDRKSIRWIDFPANAAATGRSGSR